jgi:hypothetical protein
MYTEKRSRYIGEVRGASKKPLVAFTWPKIDAAVLIVVS